MMSLYEPFLEEDPGDDWCDELQIVKDEKFDALLDLLFAYGDSFTLTVSNAVSHSSPTLEEKLRPYLIRSFQTMRWFYRTAWPNEPVTVLLYRAEGRAKELLRKTFRTVFLKPRRMGRNFSTFSSLEDLCFFKNGTMFFGTLSHEYYCDVWPPNEEFERILHTLGHWKEFPYKANKQPLKMPLG